MSQVVSLRVKGDFNKACEVFRREAKLEKHPNNSFQEGDKFIIFYHPLKKEIKIEGAYPDNFVSALLKAKKLHGGDLYYENEKWDSNEIEIDNESGPWEKVGIVLMLIFFPITALFLLARLIIWLPYQLWKALK